MKFFAIVLASVIVIDDLFLESIDRILTGEFVNDRDGFDQTILNPGFNIRFDGGIRGIKIDVAFGFADRFDDFVFKGAEFLDGLMEKPRW